LTTVTFVVKDQKLDLIRYNNIANAKRERYREDEKNCSRQNHNNEEEEGATLARITRRQSNMEGKNAGQECDSLCCWKKVKCRLI